MEKRTTRAGAVALALSIIIILAFAAVLAVTHTREGFKALSAEHPYIMGFIKFALLATVGEVLALTIKRRAASLPYYIGWRMLIWGLIGVAIDLFLRGRRAHGEQAPPRSGRGLFTEAPQGLLHRRGDEPHLRADFHGVPQMHRQVSGAAPRGRKKARPQGSGERGRLAFLRIVHAFQDHTAILDTRAYADLPAPAGVSGDRRRCTFHRARAHTEPSQIVLICRSGADIIGV